MTGSAVLTMYVRSNSAQFIQKGDQLLVVNDEPAKAEEMARWVLRFESDHHDALLLLGVSLNRQNRFNEAIEVFERAKHTGEFSSDAAYAKAACLMLEGRYQEAEAELIVLLQEVPEQYAARDMLRKLLEKTFRVHEAEELVQKQFKANSDNLAYLPECLKVSVAFPLGQAVEIELAGYNANYPGQPIVVAALARAFWLKGKTDESAGLFDELLRLDGLKAGQLVWAAQFWLETGQVDKAELAVRQMDLLAMREELSDHDRANAEAVHASLLIRQSDFTKAEERLSHAISLCPDRAEYYSRRAGIRRRLRKTDEAMKDGETGKLMALTSEELRRRSARIELGEMTPAICREVSSLYQQQGNDVMSKAWRRLADNLLPEAY